MSRTTVGRVGAWIALALLATAACGSPEPPRTAERAPNDEAGAGQAAADDGWQCTPGEIAAVSVERCTLDLPDGYAVVVETPASRPAAAPVVVVDHGQPLAPPAMTDTSAGSSAEATAEATTGSTTAKASDVGTQVRAQFPDAVVVTATPPPLAPPPQECGTAGDEGFWEACPAASIASIYLDDYAAAIEQGLARAATTGADDTGYAVVGATFAASRWAWLADAPGFAAPDSVTVVSPLHPGTKLAQLRIGLLSSTASIFGAVLEGCDDAACLVNLAPAETCLECDAALSVAEVAGTDYDTALDGLMGLSASVDQDGADVYRAVIDGDAPGLNEVLDRGAAILHGRTESGERTTERVHLLSTVCPFLAATPDDGAGWWSECRYDSRDARSAGADATFTGCSYSPQPDPVLGEAPLFGRPAGDGPPTILTARGVVAHGDLGLAADIGARVATSDARSCPAAPDEFAIPEGAPQPFSLDDAPFLPPVDG